MTKDIKELRRQARQLRPAAHVGAAGVTDGVIAQIRHLFVKNVLIKIRINSDDRAEVARIAEQLAAAVPCEVVDRTGFVAVLYCPTPLGGVAETPAEDGAP